MSTLPPQPAKSCFTAVAYPSVALQPCAPTSVVVPASGSYAVETDEASITTYPPKDNKMEYTYASYGEDPSDHIFKLFPNNPDSWTLSLSISTPTKFPKPVLRSITYIIKYATTHDNGNSTVQADVVLTTVTCPVGILSKSTDLGVYRNGPGYGPLMVDNAKALCLSSAPAIKCNGGAVQWSHYIDHRRLLPNVQVADSANLYLNFHVFEYPTAETRRCLAIEVSATWCDLSDVPGYSSNVVTTVAAPPTVSAAPQVADQGMQDLIKAKMKEFDLQECPNGYKWNKTDTGYVCGGGAHKISFAQLGMQS